MEGAREGDQPQQPGQRTLSNAANAPAVDLPSSSPTSSVSSSSSLSEGRSDGDTRAPCLDGDPTCSLYVSRAASGHCQGTSGGGELLRSTLEEAIRASEPSATWHVSETSCGLIAAFVREADAEKLLQRGDLARIFEGPVQVARFSARDTRYRQAVLLRDVPWAIPLQDLSSALAKQGIATGSVERSRQYVRVEVLDVDHYELLLRQGLDFFGAARFSAVPERWWRGGGGGGGGGGGVMSGSPARGQAGAPGAAVAGGGGLGVGGHNLPDATNAQQGDGVLQCYRCQGFWHVAANCRHLPRCVRCGEPHSVEFCPRPRNSPVCCHCAGPHHAGYRQCPVRLQLLNATPVSITLSTNHTGSQYVLNPTGKTNVSQGQHSVTPNHS